MSELSGVDCIYFCHVVKTVYLLLLVKRQAVEQFTQFPYQINTLCRRIPDMSFYILNQVVEIYICSTISKHAIQLVETTAIQIMNNYVFM